MIVLFEVLQLDLQIRTGRAHAGDIRHVTVVTTVLSSVLFNVCCDAPFSVPGKTWVVRMIRLLENLMLDSSL